jgi:serine/threonine-protein kinase
MPLIAGERLGPYEILARIGAGGMGEVWKARDTRLDRVVAIKRLNVQHSARFEQEARAIAAVNHPHICQIFDIGADYLVLEFVAGTPLLGPIPAAEALRLAIQIAGALDAAHKRGILHRDLKPDNIMVTETGAKLLDFGLAKVSGYSGSDSDLTATSDGTVMGTAPYMSPEQARGQMLDARSDLFSFGAVLYELLSGTRAFGGANMLEIMNSVVGIAPAPLDSPVWPVVQRCLAKDPAQRFQTALEVRRALESVAEHGSSAAITVRPLPSVAVLPFANMSGDREQEYFSDGLSEEIINALVKVPGLKVIARTSAFAFKGQNADIRRIAETLGVANILEGSVRRSGNRIRVTAQLIAASDGSHLWSDRFDREMADIFDVQDEISGAIAGFLRAKLAPESEPRHRYVPPLGAHEALLKGWHFQWQHTPAAMAQAREYFEQAIAFDPNFALAHSAYAEHLFSRAQAGMAPAHELMPLVRSEARRALDLDPALAEAHADLAVVAAMYEYDWAEAARRVAQATACGAIAPWSRAVCALWVLRPAGRLQEALAQAELALKEDPLHPGVRLVLAISLMGVNRFVEAEKQLRETLDLAPNFPPALGTLGMLQASQDRFPEALACVEKAYALTPGAPYSAGTLSGLLARTGETARAEELVAQMRSGPAHLAHPGLMYFHLYSGDIEQAADWTEKAIDDRFPGLAIILRSLPAKELRASARWPKLARMMNLPDTC